AALELLYLGLLARAYQEGELSVVYPVARGSAPLLILVFSLAVLGASLDAASIAGICLVAGGVVLVRGPRATASGRDLAMARAKLVARGRPGRARDERGDRCCRGASRPARAGHRAAAGRRRGRGGRGSGDRPRMTQLRRG